MEFWADSQRKLLVITTAHPYSSGNCLFHFIQIKCSVNTIEVIFMKFGSGEWNQHSWCVCQNKRWTGNEEQFNDVHCGEGKKKQKKTKRSSQIWRGFFWIKFEANNLFPRKYENIMKLNTTICENSLKWTNSDSKCSQFFFQNQFCL